MFTSTLNAFNNREGFMLFLRFFSIEEPKELLFSKFYHY